MELAYYLTGKQNFQRGNNRNRAAKVFTFKLSGKQVFLAGLPSTLAGNVLAGLLLVGGGTVTIISYLGHLCCHNALCNKLGDDTSHHRLEAYVFREFALLSKP